MIEGLWLMGVGMTTVFGFLLLLVAMMYASAAFFERFAHWFDEPEPALPRLATGPRPEIAVILAALQAHRSRGEG